MIDSKMKAPAARAWLPDAALADGTIERRIAGMVEEWSAKWIANGALTLHGTLAPVAERGSADGAEWLVLDDQLAVSANGAARLALAGLMLAMRLTERSLSADDRPIVDRCAGALRTASASRRTSVSKRRPPFRPVCRRTRSAAG
jgi:hypothetical protein